jgi:hypothetical protein
MLGAVSTPPQWFWSNHVDRVPEEVAKDSSSDDDDLKPVAGKQKGFSLDVGFIPSQILLLLLPVQLLTVANRPHFGLLLAVAHEGLLGPTDAIFTNLHILLVA